MKRNTQWPSQEAFRALYPPQDEGYMRAVRQTLANLEGEREVQPRMKKKMTFAVALAAALTALLACTALAAGMGAFGKVAELWSSRGEGAYMATLDEKSVEIGQTQVVAPDGAYPEVRLTLAQSYYDGENLTISYEATGLGHAIDYAWRPTQEELAQMDDVGVFGLTGDEGLDLDGAFVQAMADTAAKEGCAGAAVYNTYLGDGVHLAGTEQYLDLSMSEDAQLEDGTSVGMREFQTPLPDAARAQDEVAMDVTVYRNVEWHYYDGEHWYYAWDLAGRQENRVTFTVPKNTEETVNTLTAYQAFDGYTVDAQVSVTGVKIGATLTTDGRRCMAAVWEDTKPGDLYDFTIYVNGEKAKMLSGEGELLEDGRTQLRLEFALPQGQLESVAFVPQYVGEDSEIVARPEETVTVQIAR